MIGTQIGAYRIVQQIGEGGMGAVYRAEHVMLGRAAAVKVLHPEFGMRPEIVARFFNEARAATQVQDPGIVQIFDFGNHTDGSAYIVMELLDGEPLDRRLQRVGAMAPSDALRIMRQVASSLGAAHARGIVHRDLKPENIYLCRDPEVYGGERAKILDFGIAKLTQDTTGPKTHTAAVIGTPLYMSPEQCRGAGQVDQRSDIYSLGCVLSKLLTGLAPFDAQGTGELIVMHMQQPPPLPSSRVHGISPELDALVVRCLEKDPARRFANGSELAAAVEYLMTAQPITGAPRLHHTPVPHSAAAPTTLSAATGATMPPTVYPTSSKRGLWIGVGLVAVGGIVAAIVVGTRGNDTTPATPAPAPVAVTPPPAPAPVPAAKPVDTRHDDALAQIKAAIAAFQTWTKDHPHDACAPVDAIAKANDPWGQPLAITCTDQPGDQIVGITSAGPDGKLGTSDDLQSWQLGGEIGALAHGARWKPTAVPAATTTQTKPTHGNKPPVTKPPTGGSFVDLDGDGIPDKR